MESSRPWRTVRPEELSRRERYQLITSLVIPRPIGWISTVSSDGVPNLAPYSFFNAFAQQPHYIAYGSGIAQRGGTKDSLTNIEAMGEFVLNLATWDLREQMNLSSTNAEPGVDEFELSGLTKAPARLVKPFRVAESPVSFECKHFKTVESGRTFILFSYYVLIKNTLT